MFLERIGLAQLRADLRTLFANFNRGQQPDAMRVEFDLRFQLNFQENQILIHQAEFLAQDFGNHRQDDFRADWQRAKNAGQSGRIRMAGMANRAVQSITR